MLNTSQHAKCAFKPLLRLSSHSIKYFSSRYIINLYIYFIILCKIKYIINKNKKLYIIFLIKYKLLKHLNYKGKRHSSRFLFSGWTNRTDYTLHLKIFKFQNASPPCLEYYNTYVHSFSKLREFSHFVEFYEKYSKKD